MIDVGATSLTTIVRLAVSVPAVFVAVTVYWAEAATAVGVPLMVPVAVFRFRPEGSEGETEYESTVPAKMVGETACIAVPTESVNEFGE